MSVLGAAPLWGLVPIKAFPRAKSRLAPVLGLAERAALAQEMCEHVLSTLPRCPGIDGVLVISDSPEVLAVARRCGASGVLEPHPAARTPGAAGAAHRPLGLVVDEGLLHLERSNAAAALVLMADLPCLRVEELARMVVLGHDHDRVVAPDLCQRNTNALLLRLAGRTATAFGSGDSFRRHTESARAAGLRVAVHHAPGLAFDVDVPEDYEEIRDGRPCAAGNGSGCRG